MHPRPPPAAWVKQALLLIGRIHKADAATAQAARDQLQQWHAADPARAAAIEAAQRLWDATDGSSLQGELPLPPAQDPRGRRSLLQAMGIGGLIAAMGAGSHWYWRQPVLQMALETGHGRLLEQALPDGTQLSLAARSQVQVAYYRDRRQLRMDGGEVRLQVSADSARPFTVATPWGSVRVVGTIFSVSARNGRMHVAVAEGRVTVSPAFSQGQPFAAGADAAITLTAGDSVEAGLQGLGPRSRIAAQDVGAWRQGWLVFDNTPLAEVLERWNDYLQRPLRLGTQPRLREMRLTASFPLRNPQAFLNGLPDMLPVRLTRNRQGDTVVEPR